MELIKTVISRYMLIMLMMHSTHNLLCQKAIFPI